MNWVQAISSLDKTGEAYVLLTVLKTKGSSPRDTGTKMLVSAKDCFDTIGGGALEFQSIEVARALIKKSEPKQITQQFNLGSDLKQCCGGVVEVLFELFPAIEFNINIFGAGHIAQALIKILSDLDCHVKIFDSRIELFPDKHPSSIEFISMSQPEMAVESCRADSYFLVMTHDHALDQQFCEAILSRGDSRYCGLIGSHTKGLKFRQRLIKKGFNKEELQQLTCPVGLEGLKTKKPMEIALSIMADLLQKEEVRKQALIEPNYSQVIRLEVDG